MQEVRGWARGNGEQRARQARREDSEGDFVLKEGTKQYNR